MTSCKLQLQTQRAFISGNACSRSGSLPKRRSMLILCISKDPHGIARTTRMFHESFMDFPIRMHWHTIETHASPNWEVLALPGRIAAYAYCLRRIIYAERSQLSIGISLNS